MIYESDICRICCVYTVAYIWLFFCSAYLYVLDTCDTYIHVCIYKYVWYVADAFTGDRLLLDAMH